MKTAKQILFNPLSNVLGVLTFSIATTGITHFTLIRSLLKWKYPISSFNACLGKNISLNCKITPLAGQSNTDLS